ncbi:hypothetical protein I7J22_02710 [Neisseria meningitidis]|uniref:hypothetical protein n=1 Tax=Neisseria meningitidis TaxID=487 RepID=UPI0018656926|nr:hypothetical protein [Neisseria meningitidis]MBH2056582.1 hypothetical protein [Neisseria meningitidis]MBH2060262.1 hypothetical protein [Neisseria meningitidis]MBH2080622.1 hypothetical protein [Neisseria meningitidis]MBH2162649.1 hypothetical protein [Neisseria meningitidis]MBH2280211.1 hypothetical protein [Neisseria meningitidis]
MRYVCTRSPFSLQPQPTACVPCGTLSADEFKGRLKKRSQRLFHLPCDKGCLKHSRCRCFGHSFSDDLQRLNLLQPAPSPVGEGWGEGILQIAATFPNTLTAPIQASRLVALSLALSHGREDGQLLGLRFLQTNQLVQAVFYFVAF